jgi:aspartate/methionine/tyrosine aminotransferase
MRLNIENKQPLKTGVPIYTIQKWLFDTAEGKFDIDLGESGIQFHHFGDLKIERNYDLNYSLDRGSHELRQIIADMYGVAANQVIITHGTQEALYAYYHSIIRSGDHVICFAPGWQQFWEIPRTLGAEVSVVKLSAENDFHVDWPQVESAIRPNTRLMIINSPNNPTGQRFSEEDWSALAVLAKKYSFQVINDEEYELDFANSVYHRIPGATSMSSLSKTYGFPGLRIGWAVGSASVIESMINVKRYTTISNSTLCEYLGAQVLRNRDRYLSEYNLMCENGLKSLRKFVGQHEVLRLIEPALTPFASIALNTRTSAENFCQGLLNSKKVLLMPAEVFESAGFVRVTHARHEDLLKKGFERISDFILDVGQ